MKPKEKATEIYEKYFLMFSGLFESLPKIAALLCVDEIIKANPTEFADTVNEGCPSLQKM